MATSEIKSGMMSEDMMETYEHKFFVVNASISIRLTLRRKSFQKRTNDTEHVVAGFSIITDEPKTKEVLSHNRDLNRESYIRSC